MEDERRQELIERYEEFAEDEVNLCITDFMYHVYMAAVAMLKNTSLESQTIENWVSDTYKMGCKRT
jgi:LEA14-like dessication related protein